jgi:rhamnose transport system permease protein
MSTTVDQPRATPQAPPVARRLRGVLLGRDAAIVALLVVVSILGCVLVPFFASPETVYFLLLDVFPILLIALPMTLVIISAEIDLSVASMLGLAAGVFGLLFRAGAPVPVAALVALLVGVVGGALNGFLITFVGLPSLAVTVGTLALYRGLDLALLGTDTIAGYTEGWRTLTRDRLGGPGQPFPTVILLFLVLAAAFIVVLHFTPAGRAVYASGLNDEASIFSGVDTRLVRFWLFVATGTVSALAGVFWALYFNSARGDSGLGLELSVVAAVLVGGVSIFGGRGALPGVIAAVLLIGVLRSMLSLQGVTQDAINVVTGVLLIASVLVPRLLAAVGALRARSSRKAERQRTPAAS